MAEEDAILPEPSSLSILLLRNLLQHFIFLLVISVNKTSEVHNNALFYTNKSQTTSSVRCFYESNLPTIFC